MAIKLDFTRLFTVSKRRIWMGIIVFIMAYFLLVRPMDQMMVEAGVMRTPDATLAYTLADLDEMKADYGIEGGRAYLISRATFDVLWPFAYLFFMVTMLGWLLEQFKIWSLKVFVLALPFVGVLCDFVENVCCSYYFLSDASSSIGWVASMASGLKWLVLTIGLLVILILSIAKSLRLMIKN